MRQNPEWRAWVRGYSKVLYFILVHSLAAFYMIGFSALFGFQLPLATTPGVTLVPEIWATVTLDGVGLHRPCCPVPTPEFINYIHYLQKHRKESFSTVIFNPPASCPQLVAAKGSEQRAHLNLD